MLSFLPPFLMFTLYTLFCLNLPSGINLWCPSAELSPPFFPPTHNLRSLSPVFFWEYPTCLVLFLFHGNWIPRFPPLLLRVLTISSPYFVSHLHISFVDLFSEAPYSQRVSFHPVPSRIFPSERSVGHRVRLSPLLSYYQTRNCSFGPASRLIDSIPLPSVQIVKVGKFVLFLFSGSRFPLFVWCQAGLHPESHLSSYLLTPSFPKAFPVPHFFFPFSWNWNTTATI